MALSFSNLTFCALLFPAVCIGWVFYQRLISPLAKIPGPFWASISRLWYLQRINAEDMHRHTKKLHDQYGREFGINARFRFRLSLTKDPS